MTRIVWMLESVLGAAVLLLSVVSGSHRHLVAQLLTTSCLTWAGVCYGRVVRTLRDNDRAAMEKGQG